MPLPLFVYYGAFPLVRTSVCRSPGFSRTRFFPSRPERGKAGFAALPQDCEALVRARRERRRGYRRLVPQFQARAFDQANAREAEKPPSEAGCGLEQAGKPRAAKEL